MNYKLIITEEYKKRLKKFLKKHPDMFERYAKCIFILENDPFHPSLRLHKLKGKLADFHSISINMEYSVGTQRIWPARAFTLGQLTHDDLASVRIAKRATKSL